MAFSVRAPFKWVQAAMLARLHLYEGTGTLQEPMVLADNFQSEDMSHE